MKPNQSTIKRRVRSALMQLYNGLLKVDIIKAECETEFDGDFMTIYTDKAPAWQLKKSIITIRLEVMPKRK